MTEPNCITLTRPDGSKLTYSACHGSEFSPGETGWVLSMEGPGALAPRSISLTEMLNDFVALELDDDRDIQRAIALTEDMVQSLSGGLVADRKYPNEPNAQERLDQLQAELDAVTGEPPAIEPAADETQDEFVERLVHDVRGWLGQGK